MSRFLAALAVVVALTGCPKMVKPDDIPQARFCYVLSIGVAVFTDGVPCPLYESLDAVAYRAAQRWGVEDNIRWFDVILTLTRTSIDCGYWDTKKQRWCSRDAMGCALLPPADTAWINLYFYTSMWPKWRWYEIAEHEFEHVAVFLLDGDPYSMRQWCLDNREWCEDRLEFRP